MDDVQLTCIVAAILGSDSKAFGGPFRADDCVNRAESILAEVRRRARAKEVKESETPLAELVTSIFTTAAKAPDIKNPRGLHGRCAKCAGTGVLLALNAAETSLVGYCSCPLGRDLERLEKRKLANTEPSL